MILIKEKLVMSNVQVVSGVVEYSGKRLSGIGFDSHRDSVGVYTISFDESFDSLPAVVGSAYNENLGSGPFTFQVTDLETSRFTVRMVTTNSKNYDRSFSFLAILGTS